MCRTHTSLDNVSQPCLSILPVCLPACLRLSCLCTECGVLPHDASNQTNQVLLIMSGNLSFLNWLTILPAIWCLDDLFLQNYVAPATARMAVSGLVVASPSLPLSTPQCHTGLRRVPD